MKMDYDGIESCCAQLEASLRKIKAINDDCENQISKIKNGSVWYGPASESLVAKGQKTIASCRTLEISLQNIIAYIRGCSSNYQRVDSTIMNQLGNF